MARILLFFFLGPGYEGGGGGVEGGRVGGHEGFAGAVVGGGVGEEGGGVMGGCGGVGFVGGGGHDFGGCFDEERKVVVLDLVIEVIYLKHGSLRLVDLIALGYSDCLMSRKCLFQGDVFVVFIFILLHIVYSSSTMR